MSDLPSTSVEPKNFLRGQPPQLLPVLGRVLIAALGLMALFEIAKPFVFPASYTWQMRLGTALFGAAIAGLAAYFTFSRLHTSPLWQTEDFHKAMTPMISEVIFLTDDNGAFIYICPTAGTIFGYSSQEIQKFNTITELMGEVEFDRAALEQESEVRNIEWVVTDKAGRRHVLLVNLKRVSIGQGTILYVCRDITENIQAEAALRASKDRYRTLFNRVPVGLYRTTPDGQIIDANPALVKMLGYPDRETLLRTNVIDIYLYPEERKREQSLLEQSEVVNNFEMQLRRYDGDVIWVRDNVRLIRDSDGQTLYYDGSLEDITERKRAEEARALLAFIVESSGDAIIGMTLDGAIVSWNQGAERIYGYTAEEIKGKPIASLASADYQEEVLDILEKIRQGERLEHHEIKQLTKNHKPIFVSLSMSPIVDASGQTIGISAIARDITEQTLMRHHMLRSERLAAVGRITAALAHEVRNPLQAIQSNLELLSDYSLEGDEQARCLELCRHEVEYLIDFTQRVLGFARPERKTFHPFSVSQVWQQTLALLRKSLQKAAIQVTTDLPDDLPPVTGAPDQIGQILFNLVLNTIDALPNGGRLSFSGRVEQDALVLTLINNGPPIPDEYIERIFDPFFTTKSHGSGLGLFISHNIIQQHGGSIRVENLPDEGGVAFTITLPLAQSAAREEASA